jgi:hypothetical protein
MRWIALGLSPTGQLLPVEHALLPAIDYVAVYRLSVKQRRAEVLIISRVATI